MSVQVRVSFNTDAELAEVVRRLEPMVKYYKVAKKESGKFRKAYLWLNSGEGRSEQRGCRETMKKPGANREEVRTHGRTTWQAGKSDPEQPAHARRAAGDGAQGRDREREEPPAEARPAENA